MYILYVQIVIVVSQGRKFGFKMPEKKHSNISYELEKAIRSGQYTDRIPPVRILAQTYGVSLQTMSKALKTLQNSGLIVSTPGGTRIQPNHICRKNTGVVTLFMLNDTDPLLSINDDPLLVTLREEAAKDGVTLAFMFFASNDIFKKTAFWENSQSDGYIFLYSSFYPVLSRHLSISGTPYVVGNWLPDDFNAHWVDFDWKKRIFDLVRLLLEEGCRKIAYVPRIYYDFGRNFHFDLWQDICSSYELENYAADPGYFALSPDEQLHSIAQSPIGAPDIVIPTNPNTAQLLQLMDKLQMPGRLLVPRNQDEEFPIRHERLRFYNHWDYRMLARKIWSVYRQIADGTAGMHCAHFASSEKVTLLT